MKEKQMCRDLTNASWEFISDYGPDENLGFFPSLQEWKTVPPFLTRLRQQNSCGLHHLLYTPEQYQLVSSP